ncbi:hypothetical protein [Micavibrio aeruginosavorus]|uniref:hypothetical protein n=1 Tax=Micavibrio aeruginosavorus TaxID=349221 RepID=UPI003F4ACE41
MMTFVQTLQRRALLGSSVLAVVAVLSVPAMAQMGQFPSGQYPAGMGQQMPQGQQLPQDVNQLQQQKPPGVSTPEERAEAHARLVGMASTKNMLRDSAMSPESMPSLFFTAWQHALLQEAKQLFITRPPTTTELASDGTVVSRPTGPREVSLGGILYSNKDSWTVWLNGVRITKDAIPKQILDIRVARQYIDLKWFDSSTNLVFPIRLRPHERFNLDARIFLPGTGAESDAAGAGMDVAPF